MAGNTTTERYVTEQDMREWGWVYHPGGWYFGRYGLTSLPGGWYAEGTLPNRIYTSSEVFGRRVA